jgi:hypothetical protein
MTIVYVVAAGRYEQYGIVAVFSTHELAFAYAANKNGSGVEAVYYLDGVIELDPE